MQKEFFPAGKTAGRTADRSEKTAATRTGLRVVCNFRAAVIAKKAGLFFQFVQAVLAFSSPDFFAALSPAAEAGGLCCEPESLFEPPLDGVSVGFESFVFPPAGLLFLSVT